MKSSRCAIRRAAALAALAGPAILTLRAERQGRRESRRGAQAGLAVQLVTNSRRRPTRRSCTSATGRMWRHCSRPVSRSGSSTAWQRFTLRLMRAFVPDKELW